MEYLGSYTNGISRLHVFNSPLGVELSLLENHFGGSSSYDLQICTAENDDTLVLTGTTFPLNLDRSDIELCRSIVKKLLRKTIWSLCQGPDEDVKRIIQSYSTNYINIKPESEFAFTSKELRGTDIK
jgi:hypothetical protein